MNVNFAITPCSGKSNLNAFAFSILLTPLRLLRKFALCVTRVPIFIHSVRLHVATGHCGPSLLIFWVSRSGFAEGQDFCGATDCRWIHCSLIFKKS
jgi:hypothetical protein